MPSFNSGDVFSLLNVGKKDKISSNSNLVFISFNFSIFVLDSLDLSCV